MALEVIGNTGPGIVDTDAFRTGGFCDHHETRIPADSFPPRHSQWLWH
jgi:hypothetical protein